MTRLNVSEKELILSNAFQSVGIPIIEAKIGKNFHLQPRVPTRTIFASSWRLATPRLFQSPMQTDCNNMELSCTSSYGLLRIRRDRYHLHFWGTRKPQIHRQLPEWRRNALTAPAQSICRRIFLRTRQFLPPVDVALADTIGNQEPQNKFRRSLPLQHDIAGRHYDHFSQICSAISALPSRRRPDPVTFSVVVSKPDGFLLSWFWSDVILSATKSVMFNASSQYFLWTSRYFLGHIFCFE